MDRPWKLLYFPAVLSLISNLPHHGAKLDFPTHHPDLESLSTYILREIGRHETLWLFESTLDWLYAILNDYLA